MMKATQSCTLLKARPSLSNSCRCGNVTLAESVFYEYLRNYKTHKFRCWRTISPNDALIPYYTHILLSYNIPLGYVKPQRNGCPLTKMATEEHKALAEFLKGTHSSLRKASMKVGVQQAWKDHCQNKAVLNTYANCMEKLANTHWADNCAKETSEATSRIEWAAQMCYDYFINKLYHQYRDKEAKIASKINVSVDIEDSFSYPTKLIDVGSCYNPFNIYGFLDVFAIDLCPANNTVLQCDFLDVALGESTKVSYTEAIQLGRCVYDAVTFCFLLEYLPSSDLRIRACQKAYEILKPGGLLIISTPDSKHVGANSKLMKCWQFTLSMMGFSRIRYEKLKHMHCMAFRKALCKETAVRWAFLHKQPYMDNLMRIPQDFGVEDNDYFASAKNNTTKVNESAEVAYFVELPFCDT